MADLTEHKIILEGHECKEGHCPVCDGENIDYGSYEVVDTIVSYSWTCGTCGAEGQEVGEIKFIGHDLYRYAIPEQVDTLFEYGGFRPEVGKENNDDKGEMSMNESRYPITLDPGRFYIFRLKREEDRDFFDKIGYKYYDWEGKQCDAGDYAMVHSGILGSVREPDEYYDKVYLEFSGAPPQGYAGRPVSKGDIIVVTPGDEAHAFFCEGVGEYWKVDYFLEQIAENIVLPDIDDKVRTILTEDDRVRKRCFEDSPLNIFFERERPVGSLVAAGEWVGLPTTATVLGETFDRLGISGSNRINWKAAALDVPPDGIKWKAMSDMVPGVSSYNIDEVNYFAALVEKLAPDDQQKLEALVEVGIGAEDTAHAINLLHNLDSYDFLSEVSSPQKYASYLADGDAQLLQAYMEMLEIPESGPARVVSGGQFTSKGFIRYPVRRIEQVYDGKTVPEQYRVSGEVDLQKQKPKPPKKRDDGAR